MAKIGLNSTLVTAKTISVALELLFKVGNFILIKQKYSPTQKKKRIVNKRIIAIGKISQTGLVKYV